MLVKPDPVVERMVALYDARQSEATAHGRVMWDDPQKQEHRFSELLEFVDLSGNAAGSILDVGCGNGELYRLLNGRGFSGRYRGVDVNDRLIDEAKSRFPKASFVNADAPLGEPYDYVLMSGVFNANAGQTEQWVHEFLVRYFALCTKALVFNGISTHVSRRDEHLFYLPVGPVADFVAQQLSSVFEIRHGFVPFNYTVCVRKRPDWRSLDEMLETSTNA